MITHFYSDPHFGHANIIKHAARPFADLEDMDAQLCHNYRAAVSETDFVLWLGDCSWRLPALRDLLQDLPGRKALILGNHDGSARKMAGLGFECVAERMWLDLDGVPALACHYPPHKVSYTGRAFDVRYANLRPRLGKGQVCIHGHTHEKQRTFGKQRRVHVGVDAWDFAPASWHAVAALARGLVE